MQISEVYNKEEFSTIVINELKEFGVKYRKEKKAKIVEDKQCRKRIFRTHLHLLELGDVILANGSVVQIPKFVADACNRILENVETEGIFRKAGSSIRQKEIRINLEAGLPLGKTHHVIDVANVVKYFFRELPEPLIPPSMQETFLRSLLVGEHHVKAVLLTCLLLPPLTINTLSFFMQFLYAVSLNAHSNKMGAENLAIIFTPGLMPFANLNSHRFNNHLRMVQLLIENANLIGTIPSNIIDKLHISEVIVPNTPSRVYDVVPEQPKKKKKRRSGSLTQMFNGIRKIVGSAMSSENLESTPDNKLLVAASNVTNEHHPTEQQQQQQLHHAYLAISTPCIKTSKKRKVIEPVCAFSAKKKKDLLGLLPSSSGGFLPNTPLIKESKKSRMSLGGNRHSKTAAAATAAASSHPVVSSMERRWSIVGSGWSRGKNKNIKKDYQSNEDIFSSSDMSDKNNGEATTFVSTLKVPGRVSQHLERPSTLRKRTSVSGMPGTHNNTGRIEADTVCSMMPNETADVDVGGDFVHIPKDEYEEIKERVAAIESRISKEFGVFSDSYAESVANSREKENCLFNGLESVQNKYEKVVLETEALTSPGTEQLAQRLSRGLKIRRSIDQRVIRSPSARKIGTIRRRSQERVRLSRNQTWHISSTSQRTTQPLSEVQQEQQQLQLQHHHNEQSQPDSNLNSFYSRSNLKRGRPNTLHTGLNPQQYTPISEKHNEMDVSGEQWTSGEEFFNNVMPLSLKPIDFPIENEKPLFFDDEEPNVAEFTPVRPRCRLNLIDVNHTPMLPPKSVPRRQCLLKTPNSKLKASTPSSRLTYEHRVAGCTPIADDGSGRESIARLRTQNAGMVMAKTKLFDGMCGGTSDGETAQTPVATTTRATNTCADRRKSCTYKMSTPGGAVASASSTAKTQMKERHASGRTERNSFNMESPHTGRKPKVNAKSPATINKRYRMSISTKCAHKQFMDTLIRDENLTQPTSSCKPNESSLYMGRNARVPTETPTNVGYKPRSSPRTPKTRNPLTTGSPRYVHAGANGNKAYRNSPRLVKMKNGRNYAV